MQSTNFSFEASLKNLCLRILSSYSWTVSTIIIPPEESFPPDSRWCKCQFFCRLFRRSSGRSVTFDQLSPSIAGSMKSLRSRAESPNRWFNSLKNKLRKWSLDLVQALSFASFNALYFENKSHPLGSRQKIGSIYGWRILNHLCLMVTIFGNNNIQDAIKYMILSFKMKGDDIYLTIYWCYGSKKCSLDRVGLRTFRGVQGSYCGF